VGFSAALNRARGKKLGVSSGQLAVGDFPLTGSVTKICPFSHYTFLYSPYIGVPPKGYAWGLFAPPRACNTLDGLRDEPGGRRVGIAMQWERPAAGPTLPTTYGSSGQ
jgi:hypothetical protein